MRRRGTSSRSACGVERAAARRRPRDLLVLVEEPRPPSRPDATRGCITTPCSSRAARSSRVRRSASRDPTPIQGASDHGTHEAIYLPDPDGNGIELAADRPREQWPDGARVHRRPGASRLRGTARPRRGRGAPDRVAGTAVGHLHLHVGDVDEALRVLPRRGRLRGGRTSAPPLSSSAGGYHHHLGFNAWKGPRRRPAARAHARPASLDHPADRRATRSRRSARGSETRTLR